MIDGFIFMISFCIFMNVFLQKRIRYLESDDYKKYTNPQKEIRAQQFTVLSKYLLYISISIILLRLICIWVFFRRNKIYSRRNVGFFKRCNMGAVYYDK